MSPAGAKNRYLPGRLTVSVSRDIQILEVLQIPTGTPGYPRITNK